MKGRNNLTTAYDNAYFEVVRPFEVFIRVGFSESNTYYGSSMVMGSVYRRITLKPGDQVHDLFGGVFVFSDGQPYEATTTISEKGPFEKVYYTVPEEWPVENLRAIDKQAALPLNRRGLAKVPAGRLVGRSIDSIVD
jgi:hypothetical protein